MGAEILSLVTVGASAECVDVCMWSEHMRRHSIQRDCIHILRPYVRYFRSLVFSCVFMKLFTGLF